MQYPLWMLPGITRRAAEALARQGIADSSSLVRAGRTPGQRAALANATGIDRGETDRLVSVADHLRVRSLSPATAALLVEAGVSRTVQEFRARCPDAPWEHDDTVVLQMPTKPSAGVRFLSHALSAAASQSGAGAMAPSDDQLAWALLEARELAVLVVFDDDPATADGDDLRVASVARASRAHGARQTILLFGTLGSVALVGSVALFAFGARRIVEGMRDLRSDEDVAALEPLFEVTQRLSIEAWAYAVAQVATFLAIVILAAVAAGLILDVSGRAWTWVCVRFVLWNREARDEYLHGAVAEVGRARSMHRISVVTFGAAIVVAAVALFVVPRGFAGLRQLEDVAVVLAVIVVPAALALFVPGVLDLRRRTMRQPEGRFQVARTVALVRAGDVVRVFGVLVVFLAALPSVGSFALNASEVVRSSLTATAVQRAAERIQGFDEGRWLATHASEIDDVAGFLSAVTDPFGVSGGTLGAAFEGILETALPRLLRALVPTLALIAGLAIVVPFLALGGWRRGVFYLALLSVAWVVQSGAPGFVGSTMTTTFGVAHDSRWIAVFAAVALFVLAIAFEWMYESWVESRRVCPLCRSRMDDGARFCGRCGMEALPHARGGVSDSDA